MSDSTYEMEQDISPTEQKRAVPAFIQRALKSSVFSNAVLYWVLTALAFLLPVFFIPGGVFSPDLSKTILLEIAVLFGIFAFAIGCLRDGHVEIPKSLVLGATFLILIQFIASAFVSPNPTVSFFGSGYDIGTVSVFAILFLLLFLSSSVYRTRDRILYLLAAFVLSTIGILLYHLLRHVLGYPGFLDLGSFVGPTTSPVGKWNDFAVLVGTGAILSLLSLYFFSGQRMIKIFAVVLFLISLFFLILVDFTVLWMILFVFTGGLIVLSIYEGELTHKKSRAAALESGQHHAAHPLPRRLIGHLPVLAVVLLLISFVYGSGLAARPLTQDGKSIAGVVALYLKATPYSEVVLTSGLTYDIVGKAIEKSPVFGVGPNAFDRLYLLNKASDINVTPFWDTSFKEGAGRIPTLFAMTGVTGVVLWVLLLGIIFWKGRRIYALLAGDRVAAFIGIVLFFLTLYFWSVAFFYLPNIAIFSYAFLFTGALVGFLVGEGMVGVVRADFASKKIAGYILTPLLVILLVGTLAAGLLVFRQGAAIFYFAKAQNAITRGSIDDAETYAKQANDFTERDTYYRFLTSVYLAQLERTISDESVPAEQRLTLANNNIVDARSAAERAVQIDPDNFENYLATGGFYDTLGSAGVGNAMPAAIVEYKKALQLNPKSPKVLYLIGRATLLSGDSSSGRDYLERALAERPNYVEALAIVAQMDIADKKPERAIELVRNATVADPTNFVLRFSLGYLYYTTRNYEQAISSFEAAVILNPVYANAKYFLGLSYAHVGRTQDAILQFQDVAALNPGNTDVIRIINNIKAGRDPLSPNIVPPEPQTIVDGGDSPKAGE